MVEKDGGHNPFRVCFVAGNISVCNGCKGKYFKDAVPHMTCIFSMKNGVHSHPKAPQHHRDVKAMFITTVVSHALLLSGCLIPSSQVVIPSDVSSRLQLSHTDWLRGHFGLFA